MPAAGVMYRLPNVALFASGVYRGKRWTPAVVRQLAENAPALKSCIVPPAVLGHEEDQEWLDRTDLPAAGWVDPATVTAVPDPDHPGEMILRGDVVNVPAEVADRLKAGEYGYGSAEIYDDFPDDMGVSHGPTLRRFALLGGEVPQVKRLGRLPAPVPMTAPVAFAERRLPPRTRAAAYSFADRGVPGRADLIQAAQAVMPGLSQATLEVLTDDQLKELVANLPKPTPQPQPTGTAGMDRATMIAEMVAAGVPQAELDALDDASLKAKYDAWKAGAANPDAAGDVATMGDPAAMSREELIAELTANGQDAAALESMSDDDLRSLYTSLGLGATAEVPAAAAAMADPKKGMACMSDRGRARRPVTPQQATRFAEQVTRNLARHVHQARVMKVNAFADQMVREGRYFPGQLPVLKGYLLSLDDLNPVHKFSDANNRTVQGSALERAMAAVAKGPQLVRFGEKVPGGDTPAQTTHDAAVRKAENHAATIPDDAWRQTSFGSKRGFVTAFSESAKKVGPDEAMKTFGIA